jgi:hypothetical protein
VADRIGAHELQQRVTALVAFTRTPGLTCHRLGTVGVGTGTDLLT